MVTHKLNKKIAGFSLIELLVVVGIISVASGGAMVRYQRDKSKDDLLKAAGQFSSILRGASAAGFSVGRNVVVKINKTTAPHIEAWIDDDYDQTKDVGETVLSSYTIPSGYKCQIEFVKNTPTALGYGRLEFLHRGDARFNDDGFGLGAPSPTSYDGVFLRMCTGTGGAYPSTSDSTRWFSFKLNTWTSFVEVIEGHAT